MDIQKWILKSSKRVQEDGIDGVRSSLRPIYHKLLTLGNLALDPGKNIYEEEWDLLIIVDACRLDLMQQISINFDYINTVDSIRSVDSTTAFWMKKTFNSKYCSKISKTAYVCGNPFSAEQLDANSFGKLIEVWKSEWQTPGTVPPRAITDQTIKIAREENHDKIITHYMQPHCPFIPAPELMMQKEVDKWGEQDNRDVWEKFRDGDIDEETLWDGYQKNLKHVLKDVKILLDNIDAQKVIITSDHGNAVGEWGIYGHPPNSPLSCLRQVPFIETEAIDNKNYEPEFKSETDGEDKLSRDERLRALGYV
ncbi:hypothetical protein [Haladaptatus halobius]|uniref:hypothetical protein n=1 Tax=Haladaptatus halobius TaxID=2884875 RepID=UPI001D0A73B9|nr:hypothetical protein [Haladaptatus halobius]